jgi:hypothetical protein
MATFAELVTASANATLVEKIKIATLIAADNIRLESPGVASHLDRVKWAAKVFTDPATEATRMVWPVLIQNRTATLAQITGASDAAVQTAVDAAVAVVIAGA